ncbi:MAG: hypothetical protein QXP98_07730 [Thermoproteus sp.]
MRGVVVAAVLAAVFAAVGLLSVYMGSPMDVSDLAKLKGPPVSVKVSGAFGGYWMSNGYVYIKLVGRDGFSIIAVAPYSEIVKRAGTSFQFSNTVVVEGIYNPATRTLNVTTILQGCHSAYYSPVS